MAYRLGVDLGTTYTAAALNVDGRLEMLSLGNRSTQIPSVLYLKKDGTVLIGEPAEFRGAADPTRLAREFKRRIGGVVPMIVGGSPFSPQALSAKVLSWTVEVATRQQGAPPDHVCVTHPANWGPFKQEILGQVLKLAGQRGAGTCPEPEAAAIAYAHRDQVPEGATLAVYDLGGGTFDAAVLVRQGTGFRLLGTPDGVEHLGGVDFDAAVCQHVLGRLRAAPQQWDDTDPTTLLGLNRLRQDCTAAKEALSSDTDTVIPVALPGIATSVTVTRAEFEAMVRPAIGETVSAMRRALDSAGVASAELHAIVLVGGSSRIPLVAEELSAAFGRPLAVDNHPKHDVALGAALRAGAARSDVAFRTPVPLGVGGPAAGPARTPPAPAQPGRGLGDRPAPGTAPVPAPRPRPAPVAPRSAGSPAQTGRNAPAAPSRRPAGGRSGGAGAPLPDPDPEGTAVLRSAARPEPGRRPVPGPRSEPDRTAVLRAAAPAGSDRKPVPGPAPRPEPDRTAVLRPAARPKPDRTTVLKPVRRPDPDRTDKIDPGASRPT